MLRRGQGRTAARSGFSYPQGNRLLSMTDMAIETSALPKSYGGKPALLGLTLAVPRGEIFGLLGHNGAGKTTTVNILTTLLPASSGTARIAGHDVTTDLDQVRRSIGYLPETSSFMTTSRWKKT